MAVLTRSIYESRTVPAAANISRRVQVLPPHMPARITVSAFMEKPQLENRKLRATFKQFKLDFWALNATLRARLGVPADRGLSLSVLSSGGKFVALTNQEDYVFACMTTPAVGLLVVRASVVVPTARRVRLAPLHAPLLDQSALVVVGRRIAKAQPERLPRFVRPSGAVAKFDDAERLPRFVRLIDAPATAERLPQFVLTALSKAVQAAPRKHDAMTLTKPAQAKPVMVTRGTQMERAMVRGVSTTSRPTMTRRVVTATTAVQHDAEEDLEATLVPADYDQSKDMFATVVEEEEEEAMESSVLLWNCFINEESTGYKLAVRKTMQAEEELNGFDFADM